MDLTTEYLDTHEARLTVAVDEAMLKAAQNKTARALSQQIRIPGFRPGHAPTAMVIRAIGGPQAFAMEVADTLAREIYPKVLDQAKIDPYGPGKVEDVQQDPFRIVFRVPLQPKVDLKDYRSIRLPYPQVVVPEESVQRELEELRKRHAIVETVERPAQLGDLIEADVFFVNELKQNESAAEASVEEDEIGFFRRADEPFVLDPNEAPEIPADLIDAIVGMSAGEEKVVTVTFQDDSAEPPIYHQFKLRVIVRRVSSRTLPEINDELAQTASSFSTLEELRENIRKQQLELSEKIARMEYTQQVVRAFADLAEVRMPPDLIEDRLKEELEDYKETIQRKTDMPFEEWIKIKGKTEDDVRAELRQMVVQRLRQGLVMRELGRVEQITVSQEEIEQEIERRIPGYAQTLGLSDEQVRRALRRPQGIENIRIDLISQKVLDRMTAIARGEVAAQSPAEQTAPQPASAS
ncbi:MAG: trigger factor [Thermoflexales bacterium]|nr:trigger factor [Thermoflexales bacterium]